MTQANSSSPFGDPSSAHTPDRASTPTRDYRTGDIGPEKKSDATRVEVSVFRAPWPLLIAALLVMVACVIMAYWLTDLWITVPAAREFTVVTGLIILGVVLGVIFTVLTLRTHHSGRIGVTLWAVGGLLSLLHEELWPVALLGIGATVLVWLPASSRWVF